MGSHHVVPVGYELSSLSASYVAKTTGVAPLCTAGSGLISGEQFLVPQLHSD